MDTDINSALPLIALAGLGLGLVIGVVLGRMLALPARQRRHLSEELRDNQQTSATYQHEVSEHFEATSALIEKLATSYTDLHKHLADGATRLANPETGRKLAEAGSVQLELLLPDSTSTGRAHAPRDYAPGNGILSEDYGFAETNTSADKSSAAQGAADNDAAFAQHDDSEGDPTLKVG